MWFPVIDGCIQCRILCMTMRSHCMPARCLDDLTLLHVFGLQGETQSSQSKYEKYKLPIQGSWITSINPSIHHLVLQPLTPYLDEHMKQFQSVLLTVFGLWAETRVNSMQKASSFKKYIFSCLSHMCLITSCHFILDVGANYAKVCLLHVLCMKTKSNRTRRCRQT